MVTLPSLTIFTDGGSRGNPGPAATGIVIVDDQNRSIHEFGEYLGITTNNVAEYQAVIMALKWFISSSYQHSTINFKLDSKLVVEQLSRNWQIKEPHLEALAREAWKLIQSCHSQVNFSHIPRSLNARADSVVNQVLDKQAVR